MRVSTGSPTWRLFRSASPQRWRLALAGLLGALALGSAVGLMATSAYLISRAALMPPILHLQVAIVGVRAFGIGRGVFRYSERVVGHDAAFRGLARLRVSVYERLVPLAPATLGRWRRGDLLQRLVTDVDSALDLQLRVVLPYLAALLVGIGSVALAWALLPAAGMILAAALLLGGVAVPMVTLAAGGAAEHRLAPVRGRLTGEVVTTMESAADLIALQAEEAALAQVRAADEEATRLARRSAYVTGIGAGLAALVQGLAVAGSLLAGAAAVTSGSLNGILLAVVVLLPLAAYESVASLPTAVLALARVRSSAERVYEVIDEPDPSPDPADPAPLPDGPGAVTARGVAVRWPDAAGHAVSGVSFDLAPGGRLGVVGPSGSGKSTLALGLLRFLPPQGELVLDGVNLEAMSGDDVRSAIGMLAQDSHIFDTTIEENLRLARRDATAEELRAALAAAGLLPWVDGLPQGLATRVGSHGSRLSGGQRQRLGLARILLGGHRVVVLDEPTEHLDPVEGERVLRDALAALSGRSVILITHHLAEVLDCDEIVVLSGGRQVQAGQPRQLMGEPGLFAEMVRFGRAGA